MLEDLKDKRVVVTAAASGIGRHIAEGFLAAGARLYVCDVDEAALHSCLTSNGILGAGLDVLAQEPPDPDHPLLKLNNIVFTPHMGGTSQEASLRMGMVCVQNVLDAIDDKLNPDLVINWDALQRG